MQVAVVGAGAVGCYYGGLLLKAGHDVTFIGRQPHVDAINAHGLLLDTKTFNGHLPAKAATDATALASPDLVLVCVKSADTEQAGRSLAGRLRPETSVLSLQNGVDNAPRLPQSPATPSFPSWSMSAARWPGPAMSGITAAATSPSAPLPRANRWRKRLRPPASTPRSPTTSTGHAMEQADHQLRLQRAFSRG